MINVSVSNSQKVKAQVKKAIEKMQPKGWVTVGFHEDSGSHGDLTNATLAAILHFGNDRIPARPFLDVGVESEEKEYIELVIEAFENETPSDVLLEQIGAAAQSAVQNYMDELRSPPNAEITIKRKGSSNPLIDTSDLKNSVKYKVMKTKPKEGLS
jgi:phage gpG-like protein